MVLVDIDITDKGDGNTYKFQEGIDTTGYLQGASYVAYDYVGTVTTSYINVEHQYNRNYNTINNTHGTNNFERKAYFIFEGITIPQGSTIDNATLTFDVIPRQTSPVVQGTILARKTASPITYTTASGTVGYGAGTYVPARGTGNFTKPVASATKTFTVPTTTATGVPFNPTTKAEDVQAIVQELVDAFDYNNDNMMFTIKAQDVAPKPPVTTTPTFNYNNAFYIMGSETGKATTNLTINYTAGVSSKDFTIDALIQALGVNGSCTEVDVDPSPFLDSIDLATTDISIANNQRWGQRVTFTSEQVAQIDIGIKTLRVWFSGGSGSKLEFEIWADADTGQGSETIVADGGGITFVGGTAMSKKEKDFFDVPITMLEPFKPVAGTEYVIGVYPSILSGTTRKASGGDVIQGVLTGRTSGGNWTDVAGEDFSLQLVTVTTEGQHNCFEIDAQLIVAIPAQPFCINAILSGGIDVMCTEFTIDAILFIRKEDFIVDAILKAIQTKAFTIDVILDDPDPVLKNFTINAQIENQKIVTTIWMEVPDADQKIEFTVDAVLEPSFQTIDFTINAIVDRHISFIIDASITPDIGISRDVGDLIVRVLFENPPSLTGIEIVAEIVKITDAEPQWGFRGKVSRIKNWIGFLNRTGVIEEDNSDPDWYETEWSLV